jgi:glycogenin glucosyltransferase
MTSEAFITLATSDAYCLGALTWAASLRQVNTTKKIVCMITPDTISASMQELMGLKFDEIIKVNAMDSRDTCNLQLLARPDLGVTFTKLHCWRLTHFTKGVFMDADTMVIRNIDDIFEYEEFSASPDPGWPDCFNSGVFVFRPNEETYKKLLEFACSQGSFDGGDQGLLNMFFNEWPRKDISRHLPFTYNCVSQAFYSYLPAFTHFRSTVRVIHFIGAIKPWHHSINEQTGRVLPKEGTGFAQDYLQQWWNLFMREILPCMTTDMSKANWDGLAGRLAKIELSDEALAQVKRDQCSAQGGNERDRQYAWERNEIDYTGQDRFDNILNRINAAMHDSKTAAPAADQPQATTSSATAGAPATTDEKDTTRPAGQ